ncbi:MAG: selenide, water dikinase SelD [Sphaerochaetaceae bacterium]
MVRLTSMVKTSGCAAKLAPEKLHQVLDTLPLMRNDNLVEGFESSDDALVYRIKDDLMAIQTVDFFPPMVDDPYVFGQVAAANALSDIYAMGAEPSIAMNLLCFPSCLDLEVMRQILLGGQDKVRESGAVIAGGHTISDPVPKYGLCVTGFAKEDSIWSNKSARVGDSLVLTKALGVGVINTAVKAEMAPSSCEKAAIASMITLNKVARDVARNLTVHAATDITGFSLLGHSLQMAQASGVSMLYHTGMIPFIPGSLDLASLGLIPEGAYNNYDYVKPFVSFEQGIEQNVRDLLCDPQTSGGLLLSMPFEDARIMLANYRGARIIGEVIKKEKSFLLIQK